MRCIAETHGENIFGLIPIATSNVNDTIVNKFMCKSLEIYKPYNLIYLPNDQISLSWDVSEDLSQIEDFLLVLGKPLRTVQIYPLWITDLLRKSNISNKDTSE